jgi:nucleotide-binding universal stress UspA family protein
MTTNVLVPLDGSDKDNRALTAARVMAELTGSDLRLIRVLDPPAASLTPRMQTMGGEHAAQKRMAYAALSLTDAATRLAASTGKDVRAEIAEGFDVAKVLVDRAARPDISLVVMATRAASATDRAVRGSVADPVMRESARPVLLVPPGAETTADQITLCRVLVPIDPSRPSFAALEHLVALDPDRKLVYILLEVRPASTSPSDALSEVASRLGADGANVHARVIVHDNPAAAIMQVSREERVDFVAMSPRGLHGLKRFVLGSVTEAVLRGSDTPVFLLTA